MKYCLTFTILSLYVGFAFSQNEIRGRVLVDQTRAPVIAATVTLHPAGSNNILAYTISAEDGTFTLKPDSTPDSVTVSVRAMTIENWSITVKGDVEYVEFLVIEKNIELKEVIVQSPKIRQIGDTLHFDVASFLDETDRSIGDVLKKLPGIQVLSSGQILYQDKPISKFYVEGLDMLKGKYGIATQNIEAENVATVQVLENHQPIKALKNIDIPSNAAINLKLKQSALGAFFATAQAGLGLPVLLTSNELVGMRFNRSQQNMMVYKGDNTGRDISSELISFYDESGASTINFLNVISPSPPSLNQQHYLFNDAHIGSLNDLRSFKSDYTLTTNLSYLFDKQNSDSYNRQNVFINEVESIQIEEAMNSKLLKREIDGGVTIERNTDEYYLNNKFNISAKWNEESGEVKTVQAVSQNLKLPSLHLANKFVYTKREGESHRSLGVSASYTRQNNSLNVSPVLFEDFERINPPLQQNVLYNHFRTNTYLSGHHQVWRRLGLGYSLGGSINQHTIGSDLFSEIDKQLFMVDSLRNDFHRNEVSLNFSPSMSYQLSESLRPTLRFPFRYVFLDRHDRVRDSKSNSRYLLYSPLFNIEYPLTGRLSLLSNVSFQNDVGGISEDLRGYIMTSYRSMNRADNVQNESRKSNGFINLSYRNPLTALFATASISYSYSWNNTLSDVHYNGVLTSVTNVFHPHTSAIKGVDFSFGQSIAAINSEVKLFAGYSSGNSLVLNQGLISDVDFRSYYVSPSIITDVGRFMIIKYDASFRESHNTFVDMKMPKINYLTQNVNTSFIPLKGLVFNIGFNHYYNNAIKSSARSSWFGNLGVRYRMKNVDWMIDWTNIFNTRQFVTYSYSDISSFYSVYNLRPTELMLRVRFKIL